MVNIFSLGILLISLNLGDGTRTMQGENENWNLRNKYEQLPKIYYHSPAFFHQREANLIDKRDL